MDILEKYKKLSKKRKSYLWMGVSVVGVMLWAFITAGVITHNFNRSQLAGNGDSQTLNVEGIILTETKEDKKFWEIYAETGTYSSDNKVALLNNVIGNFYKDNEVSMSFESSKGTYNEEKEEVILYSGTKIALKDGTKLHCDKLTWAGSDKDVVATGHIKINRHNQFFANGDKIVITPDYQKFKLFGHTQTKIYEKDSKNSKEKAIKL